jgi:hypothetical protein
MILNQIWHGLLPYVFTTYLFIHIFIQLPITHPPIYLFTYTFSPTCIPTYIFHLRMTYLHIIYLPIAHTYLISTIRFSQILAIRWVKAW